MDTIVERQPIKSLKELLEWKRPECDFRLEKLRKRIKVKEGPKILVCHDMQGGYLDDRFLQGTEKESNYRFFHWTNIHAFIYFSHYFVTIPPQGWISAAHKNGVLSLGTVITEWDEGEKLCNELFKSAKTQTLAACKLDAIARFYGFDGWLLNIENKCQNTKDLENFVNILTEICHTNNPDSLIIWYDSVVTTGELKWQNELNASNKTFFDACDGIFLNYNWSDETLKNSAITADSRKDDVYVGIDVFGRGCLGGGGFNTELAMKEVKNYDLSIAIFAPGWVYETLDKEKFLENQYKFWELLNDYCPIYAIAELPFSTSFCQGFGNKFYRRGKVISEKPWYNLSLQQIQPSFHWTQSCCDKNNCSCIHVKDAYNSGGCLELKSQNSAQRFRLFLTNFEISSSILVIYTYKLIIPTTDISIVLQIKNSEVCYEVCCSGRDWTSDGMEILPKKRIKGNAKMLSPLSEDEINKLNCSNVNFRNEAENNWITRVFYMDFQEFKNSAITEIAAETKNNSGNSDNYSVLIGQVQILPVSNSTKMQCLNLQRNICLEENCIRVDCFLTWKPKLSEMQENSYDVFCFCNEKKYYIGTTKECFYYVNDFCLSEICKEFKFCVMSQNSEECYFTEVLTNE
ncbi:cytosolic endo-beta-N-acetylglucosaminidase-like [Centruroides sculpturatus]|uniref:cytosolic endo-beta-N-acetylglucosaminidase-like n=1 Tax=Centruroides sculpturatus TaxID=218467 RepID=UPI000C6D8983|nr:cytosolic endo-beta-N-acetylglucosaminidase-like [Centruroides sculpturatus]